MADPALPLASVIISTYASSRLRYALDAIQSVERQTYPRREIIFVVDQEGTLVDDASAGLPPSVRLVVNPAPGMANARNCGLAQAAGEIVVFLDDDAVAEPDWLARLVAHYRDENVAGVGGKSVPAWEAEAPAWLPPELFWILGCTYRGYPDAKGGDVRNMLGNSMSYRTAVLRQLRGFTLGRSRYWQITSGTAEETEVCLRLRREFPNARIVYEPDAVVRHVAPASRLRPGYLWRRAFGEGVAKARLRRLHAGTSRELGHEAQYLRHLLFRFAPQTVRHHGLKSIDVALAQIAVVFWVIAATAVGFGWTLLKGLWPLHRGAALGPGGWSAAAPGRVTPALAGPDVVSPLARKGLRERFVWAWTDVRNPDAMIVRLRRRRVEFFLNAVQPSPNDRILDVGCSTGHGLEVFTNGRLRVTGLDLSLPTANRQLFQSFVVADGCTLPFRDRAFDVVFCNGVIEHVGSWDAQRRLASEIMRVADRFFLCTNNRYFPVEPHYLMPFFQFLPDSVQRRVVRTVAIALPRGYWEPVRLLGRTQLARLFPGCRVYPERLGGLVFSWYVVRA